MRTTCAVLVLTAVPCCARARGVHAAAVQRDHFDKDRHGMHRELLNLRTLLRAADPELYAYFGMACRRPVSTRDMLAEPPLTRGSGRALTPARAALQSGRTVSTYSSVSAGCSCSSSANFPSPPSSSCGRFVRACPAALPRPTWYLIHGVAGLRRPCNMCTGRFFGPTASRPTFTCAFVWRCSKFTRASSLASTNPPPPPSMSRAPRRQR